MFELVLRRCCWCDAPLNPHCPRSPLVLHLMPCIASSTHRLSWKNHIIQPHTIRSPRRQLHPPQCFPRRSLPHRPHAPRVPFHVFTAIVQWFRTIFRPNKRVDLVAPNEDLSSLFFTLRNVLGRDFRYGFVLVGLKSNIISWGWLPRVAREKHHIYNRKVEMRPPKLNPTLFDVSQQKN